MMSFSQSSLSKQAAPNKTLPSAYEASESCPSCDQPIPHDRFDEIKARIAARQSAQEVEIASRLADQFAHEKAEALEYERQQAATVLAAQVATARKEERQTIEANANQKLAEVERLSKEAQAVLLAQLEQVEATKLAVEQSNIALREELDQSRRESESAILRIKEEAEARAETIRDEGRKQAEADFHVRILEAEGATAAAIKSQDLLRAQLDQARIEREAALDAARQEADARVSTAEAGMRERLAAAEEAKVQAETRTIAVEQDVRKLHDAHELELMKRLQEQREACDLDKTQAINAERQAAFDKQLKLSNKLEELQRALDNKTAEELGEDAELDLYDVLKGAFDGDQIERINKGQPGADILHTIIHNGKGCGSIIYDSKNHKAWRNDFVTKLAGDQMAAKADHAILSTRKFPEGMRHLHVQDGVILAAPSRVLALVQIIREHIVRIHTLRLSDEARAQKTVLLYDLITSQRCADLFARIDTHTDDLLDLQVKEKRAHENMWKKQGELIRSVQKVRAEICNEIAMIIGASDFGDQAVNE